MDSFASSRSRTVDVPQSRTVRVHAVAAPGLLARLAVVLNPHPVGEFTFVHRADRTVTLTVRLDDNVCDPSGWHHRRVAARLRRVIGVTSVEEFGSEPEPGGRQPGQ